MVGVMKRTYTEGGQLEGGRYRQLSPEPDVDPPACERPSTERQHTANMSTLLTRLLSPTGHEKVPLDT